MIISLIGYMGCGKSTLGKKMAKMLGFQFVDLDQKIEQQEQKTIAEIFQEGGEEAFRQIEHETLEQVLKQEEDMVLSLGGGTPCFMDNMKWINDSTYSIFIDLPEKTLAQRLSQGKSTRPIIAHLNDEELLAFIEKHLGDRRPFYERSHRFFNPLREDLDQLVEEIRLNDTDLSDH